MPARRDPANHLHTEPPPSTLADILAHAIPAWTKDAACASTDPDGFFPEKGGTTRDHKRVCNGDGTPHRPPCPVRDDCLAYAIDNDERFGIWGGLSERERRRIKPGPRRNGRPPKQQTPTATQQETPA